MMAMLIAWHTLNKRANPQDSRFADTFLIVTPGITVKDRLRVLYPDDANNYYAERDIVPAWQRDQLEQARIVLTNYHAFLPREKVKVSQTTRSIIAAGGQPTLFTERPPTWCAVSAGEILAPNAAFWFSMTRLTTATVATRRTRRTPLPKDWTRTAAKRSKRIRRRLTHGSPAFSSSNSASD